MDMNEKIYENKEVTALDFANEISEEIYCSVLGGEMVQESKVNSDASVDFEFSNGKKFKVIVREIN